MKLPWWGPAAAGMVVLLGTFVGGRAVERHRWEAATKVAEAKILALASTTAKLDTVYVMDTVTVAQWRTRWQTLRDTLRLSDTVLVPGPVVREIVRVGDSTVAACSRVLRDCEALRVGLTAQRDSLVQVLERGKRPPNRFGCTVGVTYTAADLLDHRAFTDWSNRVGATCGWRVRF